MNWYLVTHRGRYFLQGLCLCIIVAFACLQVISTTWAHACKGDVQDPQKRRITAVLFDLEEDDVDASTNYTYNDYSCHPEWHPEIPGYDGGHSGWDVQTTAEHDEGRNDKFYALTDGEVIRDDEEELGKTSVIAIYNPAYDITIIYLHARSVNPRLGLRVKKGNYLGRQGNTGLDEDNDTNSSHVHVEIRKGEWDMPSNGIEVSKDIKDGEHRNIDPIPILHKMLHDVDQDRQVDNIDALIVFLHMGSNADDLRQYDINNDGSIDLTDVRLVMENMEVQLAAPRHVESTPNQTLLFANFPNPFNPETWIPYHLATSTDVQINIYNGKGTMVRALDMGHQAAGYYTSRSRAAYWDGRNQVGEPVASGVYFYTFTAGDFTATRKMLVIR